MNFIMFLESPFQDMLFSCLVTKEGLDIIKNLETMSSPDNTTLIDKIEKNIIASIVLKRAKQPCNDSFELINWAASKPGAGTILLMYLLNHGVNMIADRASVSPLARKAIMKMANSPVGKMLTLKPLDNYLQPVTRKGTDDCQTFTSTGGFAQSKEGIWQSKLDSISPDNLNVNDYMDFSINMDSPKYIPAPKITQEYINNLSSKAYGALRTAIGLHFGGELVSSMTKRGRYAQQSESERKVKSVNLPDDALSNLPPETVITENKLKKMIIESLLKQIIVK